MKLAEIHQIIDETIGPGMLQRTIIVWLSCAVYIYLVIKLWYFIYPRVHVHEPRRGLDVRKTSHYNFETVKVLGHSPFCKVVIIKRVHKLTQVATRYAVKLIDKTVLPIGGAFPYYFSFWAIQKLGRNEGSALASLFGNPYLTGHLYGKTARGSLYYILDMPQGDTLSVILAKEGAMKKSRTRHTAAELISAIQFIHSKGMVLGRFDLESIFIGNNGHVTILPTGLLTMDISEYWTLHNGAPLALPSTKARDFDQDWYDLAKCLISLVIGQRMRTSDERAINVLTTIVDPCTSIVSLVKLLMSKDVNNVFSPLVRTHPFFQELDWNEIDHQTSDSPLFLAHDLESLDRYFSAEDIHENDANVGVEEVIRVLEGPGKYKVHSI